MQAGRELDALVAEKVMGFGFKTYAPVVSCSDCAIDSVNCEVPPYSTAIAAAWLVVENLREQYVVELSIGEDVQVDIRSKGDGAYIGGASAARAPLAICLAALKAVGYAVDTSQAC